MKSLQRAEQVVPKAARICVLVLHPASGERNIRNLESMSWYPRFLSIVVEAFRYIPHGWGISFPLSQEHLERQELR